MVYLLVQEGIGKENRLNRSAAARSRSASLFGGPIRDTPTEKPSTLSMGNDNWGSPARLEGTMSFSSLWR